MLGAAVAAAPTANLSQVLEAPVGGLGISQLQPAVTPMAHAGWVREALKKLIGKSAAQKEYERRQIQVHQFDPNVAALRSVSVTAKVRMSRDRLYERSLELERMRLEHLIGGL